MQTPTPSAVDATLLDTFLPVYEFRDVRRMAVTAAPERIFAAVDTVTLDDMPLARWLGNLRYLPGRLTGTNKSDLVDRRPFRALLAETGNITLGERPGREVVIGVIGKFHQLTNQEPVQGLTPTDFLRFDDPAYQKLAQSFRLVANAAGGHDLVFEHRTHALSEQARRQFARYWVVIRPTSAWLVDMLLAAISRRAEGT